MLIAALSLGFLTASMSAFAAKVSTHIALISQTNGPSYANDLAIKQHLEALGYTVQILDQLQDPKQIKQVDAIILSSTVGSKNLKAGWRQLEIPLMTWESDLNAPHRLSANLPAGTLNVYKKQTMMNWGKPGLGATIIATVYGEPEKAAIWGYEKGATMDYESLAPAKRLMFFLHNDTFSDLSSDGVKLFDASVKWLMAPENSK